ncbi:unnamed protein product [Debaryomyces tyrocola]|nr:unnamed protein product [Debaryomyces tyrocola]
MPGERTEGPSVTPALIKDVTTHMFTYLLPLLLIYISGHNSSIFGRSLKSHRPICGTGQPRIPSIDSIYPCSTVYQRNESYTAYYF